MILNELFDGSKKKSEEDYWDPEVKRKADKAYAHYPYYSRQGALLKAAVRGLAHSEENDQQQQARLDQIEQELADLKQSIAKLTQR
jgi:hypothetical protein